MAGLFDRIMRPMRLHRLKQKYIAMHGGAGDEAARALERQLSLLKNKRPGQSDEWYLKKIIYDLERDRRR